MGHREPRVGSNTYTTARRTRNAGPGNPDDVGAAHLGSARDRHARSSSRLSSHGWDAPRTERTDRGPFRASRRNRFVKRGGARRATSAGMQTGPGSRGECNGVLVVRENDTGASPVARSSGGQLRARCRAPQERRGGRGTGDGGRGRGEGDAVRASRAAGISPRRKSTRRVPLLSAGLSARFHSRLPPVHRASRIRLASRRPAPDLPAPHRSLHANSLVSSNLPRLTRGPVAHRCIGGRATDDRGAEGQGPGGREGCVFGLVSPRRDPRSRVPVTRTVHAARVAARVRDRATTRGCGDARRLRALRHQ